MKRHDGPRVDPLEWVAILLSLVGIVPKIVKAITKARADGVVDARERVAIARTVAHDGIEALLVQIDKALDD